jgi:predicted outer membrane repeat protein
VKRVFLLTFISLLFCQLALADTIFVKPGGKGDGSSWERAFGSLHDALRSAKFGDEIWLAAGTYYTSNNSNTTRSFLIPTGVKIYGGFAGIETSLEARNIEANRTVLSGEIGNPDSPFDNAYTVVTIKNADASTTLDGLVITGGNAIGDKGIAQSVGAAIFNDGSNGESSPTIMNCTFIENAALNGGAIYNSAHNGNCNPIIQNCKFIKNKSYVNGGAIYNDSSNGNCAPKIINCTFRTNMAGYGGAILNKARNNGYTSPLVKECFFVENIATDRGSSIHNDAMDGGQCKALTIGNRYKNNSSSDGHDISNSINTYDFSGLDTDGNISNTGY